MPEEPHKVIFSIESTYFCKPKREQSRILESVKKRVFFHACDDETCQEGEQLKQYNGEGYYSKES